MVKDNKEDKPQSTQNILQRKETGRCENVSQVLE
jgi:hypothetical protein